MYHARKVTVALLSAAIAVQAYSIDAAATAVNVDEVAVVRNGATAAAPDFWTAG
jgi:hypothetical protein